VALAGRHVDDDRALRDVGAALEQSGQEQAVLRVEAHGDARPELWRNQRGWIPFQLLFGRQRVLPLLHGNSRRQRAQVRAFECRTSLHDVWIVWRAASGRTGSTTAVASAGCAETILKMLLAIVT
jgi:hypothetical protein